MKVFKYCSMVLIIALLTVGIVLLPETVMIGKTVAKNNSKTIWKYTNSESEILTPQQFVILYTTGDVALNPLLHESYFTNDEEEITKELKTKLADLFHSDSELHDYFRKNIGKITYHEKRSALTLFMDEMIALRFSEVKFGNNATLIYEEKTGVITEFSVIVDFNKVKQVISAMENYYVNILELDYYSYYCIDEKITDEGYFVSFALEPKSEVYKAEKTVAEQEYTN